MALTRIRAQQISDIDYKQAVRVIALSNITLSGGAPNTVDGVNLAVNNRVLVAGQDLGKQNGLYRVATLGTGSNGTWVRTDDGNQDGEIEAGMIVMVTEGDTYKDTQWKLITNNPIVIDTTPLTFEQNSAFAFGNIYANGTAVLSSTTSGTVILSPGDNIAITGNNASKTVTISAAVNAASSAISNGTSNVTVVSSGGNVTTSVAGTSNVIVVASTGSYITGIVSATGNIIGGNISATNHTGTTVSVTGNIIAGNINGGANVNAITHTGTTVSVSGNIDAGNLRTGGLVSATGTITTASTLTANNVVASGTTSSTLVNASGVSTGGALLAATGRSSSSTGVLLQMTGNSNPSGTNGYLVNGQHTLTPQGDLSNWYGILWLPTFNTYSGNVTNMFSTFIRLDSTATGNANVGTWYGTYVSAPSFVAGSAPKLATWIGHRVADPNNAVVNPTTAYAYSSQINRGANRWGLHLSGTADNYIAGNVGIGTATPGNILDVTGSAYVSGNISGGNLFTSGLISATGNITGGNIVTAGTVKGATIDSSNADLAERYLSDRQYPAGTVVVFGGVDEITQSTYYADPRIAGVISTAPAYCMNVDAAGQPVALQGRVPCRVVGSIQKGDLITSSDQPGVATKLNNDDWVPGCVIGKALANYDSEEVGEIEVVVGRV